MDEVEEIIARSLVKQEDQHFVEEVKLAKKFWLKDPNWKPQKITKEELAQRDQKRKQ